MALEDKVKAKVAEQKKPFYYDNTVEVVFPDGKKRRVFKGEAEALKKKLATPKFQKMFGADSKKPAKDKE